MRVAKAGEPLEPGVAYVAPDKLHMGVRGDRTILLDPAPQENGMRPAVSYLFRSVLEVFGANTAAVMLTGMGKDGVDEMKVLKDAGAITVAQDKESSIVHGMPGQAIEAGAAIHVLTPNRIAQLLSSLVTTTP